MDLDYNPENRGNLSSLALAHVGDAVYELLIRTKICEKNLTNSEMHRHTVRLVCAPAQAQAARALYDSLTEEEQAIFRRARNTKVHRVPQGCTQGEYCLATALEALFGSLYLDGRHERIHEIFSIVWENLPKIE